MPYTKSGMTPEQYRESRKAQRMLRNVILLPLGLLVLLGAGAFMLEEILDDSIVYEQQQDQRVYDSKNYQDQPNTTYSNQDNSYSNY